MSALRQSFDSAMRGASLVILDRRWAGPLAGMALGFGIFVGVAVGPQTVGSQALSGPIVVEVPAEEPAAEEPASPASGGGNSGGGGGLPTGPSSPGLTAPVLPPLASPTTTTPVAPPPDEDTTPTQPAEEPPEEPQMLTGVVAHVNDAAGSYTLAADGGALYSVHTKHLPKPGVKQRAEVRELANGTYGEDGDVERLGKSRSVELAGTVTYIGDSTVDPAYAVSAAGASILVHVEPPADGSIAKLPELGAFGTVQVALEAAPKLDEGAAPETTDPSQTGETPQPTEPPPTGVTDPTAPPATTTTTPAPSTTTATPGTGDGACAPDPAALDKPVAPAGIAVERNAFESLGEPSTFSDFAGVVKAVCADQSQIVISGDDIDEAGGEIRFTLDDGIDATQYDVGDSIAATASIAEDGDLTMSGLASDEQAKGADDDDLAQGDLAG